MRRRDSGESERFVEAVYRRLIFFHVIEQLGLGFLIGSVFAIVIALLAFWQWMPTLPILILCGGLGLLIGIGLTIYHWPTRWFAVLETDRQLNFSDLLSSAILAANQTDDDLSLMVRAMADARCRQHAPGDVFLRKLNAQTWGGIATVIAIACTLCVLPTGLQKTEAMDANSAALAGGEFENGKSILRTNNAASDGAGNADAASQIDQAAAGRSQPGDANHSVAKNGTGSGGGGSSDFNSPGAPLKFDHQGSGESSEVGDLAGGGGSGGRGGVSPRNFTGSQARNDRASKPVPAWHADSSANQSATGPQSPGSSHIPAEDADLIRDFFKPR